MMKLSDFLDEFSEERGDDCYAELDLSDAIHEYTDTAVVNLDYKELVEITNNHGGVFKLLKKYREHYGDIDLDDDEIHLYQMLVYCLINEYITDNYLDPESESD